MHECQDFESATWNMLSQFSREPRELPWQPNLNKNKAKCTDFSCLQEIEDFFAWKVRILSRRLQICYLNFQGNQGSCHGNQIWTKISQNCTDFSSVQEIEEFFAWKVRILGRRLLYLYPTVCKTPDVPLQHELLCWTFVVRGGNWPADITSQLRASQSSVLTWMGILIQSMTHITCDLEVEVVHAGPTSNMLLT